MYITGKRPDGYHNLETVFLPLPFYDVVELLDAPATGITTVGKDIPGPAENNIIIKAWKLLKEDFPDLPPVHFYLLKNIPAGAGLGAGSANGACTLAALNQKFSLGLTPERLAQYALQLGSDCPFFILNKPARATGRGEVFEEVAPDLRPYKIILINPGIHIATPWAFSQVKPAAPSFDLKQSINRPLTEWKHCIFNDFETAVFKKHPEVSAIKQQFYEYGAVYAAMSGSGSSVYGIFEKNNPATLPVPDHYFVKEVNF